MPARASDLQNGGAFSPTRMLGPCVSGPTITFGSSPNSLNRSGKNLNSSVGIWTNSPYGLGAITPVKVVCTVTLARSKAALMSCANVRDVASLVYCKTKSDTRPATAADNLSLCSGVRCGVAKAFCRAIRFLRSSSNLISNFVLLSVACAAAALALAASAFARAISALASAASFSSAAALTSASPAAFPASTPSFLASATWAATPILYRSNATALSLASWSWSTITALVVTSTATAATAVSASEISIAAFHQGRSNPSIRLSLLEVTVFAICACSMIVILALIVLIVVDYRRRSTLTADRSRQQVIDVEKLNGRAHKPNSRK
jgi:hypothetical protein